MVGPVGADALAQPHRHEPRPLARHLDGVGLDHAVRRRVGVGARKRRRRAPPCVSSTSASRCRGSSRRRVWKTTQPVAEAVAGDDLHARRHHGRHGCGRRRAARRGRARLPRPPARSGSASGRHVGALGEARRARASTPAKTRRSGSVAFSITATGVCRAETRLDQPRRRPRRRPSGPYRRRRSRRRAPARPVRQHVAVASWPVAKTRLEAVPRSVSGISASAAAASAAVTPGTTSKGMPAARSAAISSPARPKTSGSPAFSRTTRRPADASRTRIALISSCVADGRPCACRHRCARRRGGPWR